MTRVILTRLTSIVICCCVILACEKTEYNDVLKKSYDATSRPAEPIEDFTVQLLGRALQQNETGQWKIIKGEIQEGYVAIENVSSPFSKFTGLPGEEYQLEWTITKPDRSQTSTTISVRIPDLHLEIEETTPSAFQTIRLFHVNPMYKGKWSFDKPYGYIFSRFHDGSARPDVEKPSIELHGYSHTKYKVSYTASYAGRSYTFSKEIETGEYQEDEALQELQMGRGDSRVVEDRNGRVIELNLQASGTAYMMENLNTYPSFRALKHLRTLILGGSSVSQIPQVIGDYYLDMENLSMDRIGQDLLIPENIGNLSKLKTFLLTPLRSPSEGRQVTLPKSFAKLKSLEELTIRYVGLINFNGTLGGLENLRHLDCFVTEIPDNIGNLSNLTYLELIIQKSYIPEDLSKCENLEFVRLIFQDQDSRRIELPSKIGNLKRLETVEITSDHIYSIPESIGGMSRLRALKLEGNKINNVPSSIGDLSELESLILGGNYTRLPERIGNLKNLKFLSLSPTLQVLPEDIGGLSSLEYLNINSTQLVSLPSSFGNLKKLKEIAAWQSQIKELPPSFGGLDALEKIDFGYSKFQAFPEPLVRLKNVHTIILNGTSVGRLPSSIYDMREGVFFDLYHCNGLDFDQLREIVRRRTGLIFKTDYGWIS